MHAIDKLNEAKFFLRHLRKHPDGGSDFRYFMSAFLAAARSVTFTLQKDLRSDCGDAFENWYREKLGEIDAHPMGPVINQARTVFQKEGNKLYWKSTFGDRTDDAPTVVVEYNEDKAPAVDSISFKFPKASDQTYWRITREPGQSDKEVFIGWLEAHFGQLVADTDHLLRLGPSDWEVSLTPHMERVHPEVLLEELESFIALLEGIVDEAQEKFGGQ